MFETRRKAKAVQFPVLDAPPVKVAWLDTPPANREPVRKLFQTEEDEPPPPRPESAPPPPAATPPQQQTRPQAPPPQPPKAAPPESLPPPPPAATREESQPLEPMLDDRVLSKLPPPPKIGSLIPGGRSAPPPANDVGQVFLNEHAEAFANAAVELAIARAATLSMMEGQLLDLAVEIAEALIEREVEHVPDLHAVLARAALSSLGDTERVTLRTSPDGYEVICAALGGHEARVQGVLVQVSADASIPGLGCVVDGDNMRVDATVSERLRAVRRAFEDERRKVVENQE